MTDRQGTVRQSPMISVSVGIAMSGQRSYRDHREVVEVATEMKAVAKANLGSAIAMDRRGDSPFAPTEARRDGVAPSDAAG